jgi:enoyl-CoA hydratase/carnithine racemase
MSSSPILENLLYEKKGAIAYVTLNRPKVLNALNQQTWKELRTVFEDARDDPEIRGGILTGAGDKAFIAGADIGELAHVTAVEAEQSSSYGQAVLDLIENLGKPVIAAVNGYAMGGGFMLVERTDLRVAAKEAIFEVSEAKRWLLGGYNHGHIANVPYPVAMEMALGFRFTAQRFYEVGFLNRVVEADQLMPTAMAMAEHLLTLPPASRVNTVHMMRQMRPVPSAEHQSLAAALHEHGAKSDLMESRAAFAEKRRPNFKGWDDPQDRYRLPTLDALKG